LARFYSNENVALPLVLHLRTLGHDVLTSLDAGNANSAVPDVEVLAFATNQERILLTYNRRHFLQIHRSGVLHHSGMVLCKFDGDFEGQARRVDQAIAVVPDMRNRVVRVNRPD